MSSPFGIFLKLFITGTEQSGKTQFIKSVSEIPVVPGSGDPPPLHPMDFGRITINEDLILYFFGTSDTFRPQKLWFMADAFDDSFGIIYMVDSRSPETFLSAMLSIHSFNDLMNVPYIVVANYQDYPDAWDPNDIQIALDIDDDIPVVPCVATDKESVKNVLLELMDVILRDIE